MAKLKFAFITDVHYGRDTGGKLGSKAPKLMKFFAKVVNKFAPDLVVDGGDRVSAHRTKGDNVVAPEKIDDVRQNMKSYRAHFNEIAAPLESILGNHDLENLTAEENSEIMGTPSQSYSKDVGGYHLIFWNPSVHIGPEGLHLAEADLQWLEHDLARTDKKTILFSHVPLDNDTEDNQARVTGQDFIDGRFYYGEGQKAQKILEDSGKVVLCMHGHRHRNRHREINGIHYITQQSFSQQWQKEYRVPARAFSLVEADDEKITVRLMGKVRKVYEILFNQPEAALAPAPAAP